VIERTALRRIGPVSSGEVTEGGLLIRPSTTATMASYGPNKSSGAGRVQEKLIVRIADRPELAPIVAGWLWHEWWHQDGYTLEQTHDAVAASVSPSGPPQSFVLLVDGTPIGTASLVVRDLDERPDLTPWLAGVFVISEARGRGHNVHLIQAVEAACRSAAIHVVWLYTAGAERVYARAGWHSIEII
jgi:GNAT superfamily N-acetyltransferase